MNAPAALPKVSPLPRRHKWGDGVRVGERLDHTERTCALCGMVKITVHPPQGFPWREWRTREGKPWQDENTPPCLNTETPETLETKTTA